MCTTCAGRCCSATAHQRTVTSDKVLMHYKEVNGLSIVGTQQSHVASRTCLKRGRAALYCYHLPRSLLHDDDYLQLFKKKVYCCLL